jgi:tetratricopeptide (TPR) repeat protein
VVSPTGIVYEIGVPPVETRFSQASTVFLAQGFYGRALEQAQEGLAQDATEGKVNSLHHLLAGLSLAGLGDFEAAMGMWDRAKEIYPAYELEVEPARETAWAEAFNTGIAAYDRGEVDSTIVAWRKAVYVYDLRPDVHRNLASLLAEDARYDEAIEVYRAGIAGIDRSPASWVLTEADIATREEARRSMERDLAHLYLQTEEFALAEPLIRRRLAEEPEDLILLMSLGSVLVGMGGHPEARTLYLRLLERTDLEDADYFNIGVSLFEAGDFSGAARAFKRVTDFLPNGRDAWFNYANALLALESWVELIAIGAKLTEVDPLGESSALILARAYLEIEDEEGAIEAFERTLLAPVHITELRMEPLGLDTRVTGRLVGNEAPAGSEVALRFLFYSGAEALGSEVIRLRAPEKDSSIDFEVLFDRSSVAYRYELVAPNPPIDREGPVR